ncbi:MAG: hypothetical protein ABF254_00730 [Octadecabacter sp.]
MQPLIYKASIQLASGVSLANTSLGDHLTLSLEDDCRIAVLLKRPSSLPFGLGRPQETRVGVLNPKATALIMPALLKHEKLRVRVVGVEPAHLSASKQATLFVSIWGNPNTLSPTADAAP